VRPENWPTGACARERRTRGGTSARTARRNPDTTGLRAAGAQARVPRTLGGRPRGWRGGRSPAASARQRGVPGESEVDAEVAVDGYVAGGDHILPRHLGMSCDERGREGVRGLADHPDVVDDPDRRSPESVYSSIVAGSRSRMLSIASRISVSRSRSGFTAVPPPAGRSRGYGLSARGQKLPRPSC